MIATLGYQFRGRADDDQGDGAGIAEAGLRQVQQGIDTKAAEMTSGMIDQAQTKKLRNMLSENSSTDLLAYIL